MAGLGLILAGAAGGMGGQMVENARMKREEALRAQERKWQLQDRQQDRDWQNADYQRGIDRQDQLTSDVSNVYESLFGTESGGNFNAANSEGYVGRSQFGQGRLDDWASANGAPRISIDQFRANPDLQVEVEQWHFQDINDFIDRNNLEERFAGQTINGVPITRSGMIAMAHLGGQGGMRNFLESNGEYDPADSNGTNLSDYARTHGGLSTDMSAVFDVLANPDVPESVRDDIRTGLGIGVQPDEGVTNPFWRDNGDGTKTRMGTNSRGQTVEVMGVDGKPVIETNTPSASDRADEDPADLKSTTLTRIENLPAVMLPSSPGRDPQPDPNLIAVVAEEVLRLMTEENLSETAAYAKAIGGMQFDTVETRPAESGWISDTPAQTAQRFTGTFNYDGQTEEDRRAASTADSPLPADPAAPTGLGGAAGTEPTRQAQPLPTNRDDLVTGQVYTFRRDGQTITARFDGTNLVAME